MKWGKILTTKQEYEKALKRLLKIFDYHSDRPEGMEAELLVTLIDKYEKGYYPIEIPRKMKF